MKMREIHLVWLDALMKQAEKYPHVVCEMSLYQ